MNLLLSHFIVIVNFYKYSVHAKASWYSFT